MSPTLKRIIGVLAAIFILSIAYYGNYLPLNKSQTFIKTLQGLSSAHSLKEFEDMLSVPLAIPSPIGQEELVRNSANIAMNLVQQNNDPKTIGEIINFLEKYYQPIIDYGRGMSFEQNLYVLGTINEIAFVKTHQIDFLRAADKYFRKGLELGPQRPQFLYGMFDVYRTEGNVDASKQIAAQILSQWPDDARTQQGLEQFLNYVASSTAAKTKVKK
jgi:hypothetical protein